MSAKATVGDRVRGSVKMLVAHAGLDVRRLGLRAQPELRRAALLHDGGFTTVLDVGANRGDYGLQLRRHGYTQRIVSFEPLSGPYASLATRAGGDSRWECRRLAIGDSAGVQTMNVAANDGASSSFFAMSARLQTLDQTVRYVGSEEVQVGALDDVLPEVLGSDDERVWLKLDVQGYELAALNGARDMLARINGLEIEMSLVALYEDQPLIDEVLATVRGAGFDLLDLEPAYRDPGSGRVLQVDGIAVRR